MLRRTPPLRRKIKGGGGQKIKKKRCKVRKDKSVRQCCHRSATCHDHNGIQVRVVGVAPLRRRRHNRQRLGNPGVSSEEETRKGTIENETWKRERATSGKETVRCPKKKGGFKFRVQAASLNKSKK